MGRNKFVQNLGTLFCKLTVLPPRPHHVEKAYLT